jgi:CheY-like chemotaxis protein
MEKIKILIVDDQGVMQRIVKNVLKTVYAGKLNESNFIFASNGKETVEKVLVEKPSVVFLDWMMPVITGYEALKIIRSKIKDLPIVMVTSLSQEKYEIESMTAGANDYIRKPVREKDFIEVLKNLAIF